MLKIGNSFFALFSLMFCVGIHTSLAEDDFEVEIDQNKISIDDTVSLTISSSRDTSAAEVKAPDFLMGNQYTSMNMQSYYDGAQGRFVTQTQRKITRALTPKHTGMLKIAVILPAAQGKPTQTREIVVEVMVSRAGRASGHRPGGATREQDDQQPDKQQEEQAGKPPAFIQAEVKKSAFKGEQLIVSYYLYQSAKIFNVEVEKYPMLSGFLRQDLDLPIVGQRFTSQPISRGGILYNRTLLAQYAAYPLQVGTLTIDSMAIKFNYYNANSRNPLAEEDPFFGFFQQMAPRSANSKSEVLQVNVLPLPAVSSNFSGVVGDFNVIATVNKSEVHANEAVSFTIKITGQGSLSSMAEPKVVWPDSVELYESKGRPGLSKGGVNEKIIEYLLIPRSPGVVNLPTFEFVFFDPNKKQYYTKTTDPFQLKVLDPVPGSALVPVKRATPVPTSASFSEQATDPAVLDVRPLKPLVQVQENHWPLQRVWQVLYGVCLLLFIYFFSLVGVDFIHQRRRTFSTRTKSDQLATWESLMQAHSPAQMVKAYEALSGLMIEEIEKIYVIRVKGLSRNQLKTHLVEEKGVSLELWEEIVEILSFCDQVRFAGQSVASDSIGASQFKVLVTRAQRLVERLSSSTRSH